MNESRLEKAPIGLETMSPAMREMQSYPRYLLDQVTVFLGKRVWEIGVGNGQYTRRMLELGKQVLGTDIDTNCLTGLTSPSLGLPKQWRQRLQTSVVDLTDRVSVLEQGRFQADSILCFNVLEHIEDHRSSLEWIGQSVQQDAVLALIVPAHPSLYGKMDREAGHFRRYTRSSTQSVLQDAGWQVEQCRYINWVGAVGWWYHNRVRKSAGLGDSQVNQQMKSIDRWLPRFAAVTDPTLRYVGGMSVLAIARNRRTDGGVDDSARSGDMAPREAQG